MTVGSVHTPGPDAVDVTPEKDGGILKEVKVGNQFTLEMTSLFTYTFCRMHPLLNHEINH